jgi:flavodoxin
MNFTLKKTGVSQKKSIVVCLFFAVLILTVPPSACAVGGSSQVNGTAPIGNNPSTGSNTSAEPKILVAYFSQTGNTRKVAVQIQEQTGGDLFRIETAVPYPGNMPSLVNRKNQEIASGNMPELKANVGNIKSYDVIFLGYPIWAMTAPPPVRSFIETHDLTGKTIVPFCTHDGYGPGNSVAVITRLLPTGTNVLDVFDIKGSNTGGAKRPIMSWLEKIGIVSSD